MKSLKMYWKEKKKYLKHKLWKKENSKKQKKTFTVQAISNIILSLAVSAGAENEPEWTVTEHMDGAPIYIVPENRLRIW